MNNQAGNGFFSVRAVGVSLMDFLLNAALPCSGREVYRKQQQTEQQCVCVCACLCVCLCVCVWVYVIHAGGKCNNRNELQ